MNRYTYERVVDLTETFLKKYSKDDAPGKYWHLAAEDLRTLAAVDGFHQDDPYVSRESVEDIVSGLYHLIESSTGPMAIDKVTRMFRYGLSDMIMEAYETGNLY